MPRYDASNAEVLVYSFKDGVLAKMAHDLKLRVGSFTLNVDDASKAITATFDPKSLEVVCRRKDGHDDEKLNAVEAGMIKSNIQGDVLETKKHGEIRFTSTSVAPEGDGYRIRGELALHGRTKPIEAVAKKEGSRLVAEVKLDQPDFGIKPFSAMMGALKVKPEVVVTVSVPAA